MMINTIGIDVSKSTLDVHRHPDGDERRFSNDAAGHKGLIQWVGGMRARLVFEPTGPYHVKFERALSRAGLTFVKINPRRARRFAEATGRFAKTDRLDAALLARMAAILELDATPPRDEALVDLKELLVARDALIKDRTATKNRATHLRLHLLKQQNARTLKDIDRKLADIDQEIVRRIAADHALNRRFEILTSIPGIAEVTAFTLLIEMPELGTLQPGQAASLAGLAPMARQSGQWRGKAFIKGGRATVRRALYMPALVACRFNPQLKAWYSTLIEQGKPAKVAITAVMRKLIVLANALLRDQRNWTPQTS